MGRRLVETTRTFLSPVLLMFLLGCSGRIPMDDFGRPVFPEEIERFEIVQDGNGYDVARIHYLEEGFHMASLDTIAAYSRGIREAWDFMYNNGAIGTWAFPAPDDNRGGDDLLDVYVWMPHDVVNGRAVRDLKPNSSSQIPSYITLKSVPVGWALMPTEEKKDLFLRMVAAHELNHVSQYGYQFYIEDVWTEGTAVWFTQELYDIFHTLPELATPLIGMYLQNVSSSSLFATETEPYSAYAPFLQNFLTEYFDDPRILEEIWHRARPIGGGYDVMDDAFVATVESRGHDADEVFQVFTEWNFMTCKNDDGLHYQWNRDLCPFIGVPLQGEFGPQTYPSDPVVIPTNQGIRGGASDYWLFETDDEEEKVFTLEIPELETTVDMPEYWGISVIRKDSGSASYDLQRLEGERYSELEDGGTYEILLQDWNDYEQIVIVVQRGFAYWEDRVYGIIWPQGYSFSLT